MINNHKSDIGIYLLSVTYPQIVIEHAEEFIDRSSKIDQISVSVAQITNTFRHVSIFSNINISIFKSSKSLLSMKISFGIRLFEVGEDVKTLKEC